MRCVIVDDDPFIQELLKDKLLNYFPEISLEGVASNGHEGIQLIKKLNPDLVFLDVEMTDMTGFEMLAMFDELPFKIIFITSYKHYAIKAIRSNALDYLLKPFDLEELKNAISRFKKNHLDQTQNLKNTISTLKTKSNKDDLLTLKTQQGDLFIPLDDIIHIEGERNYSLIHLVNQKKELVSKTLSNLEDLLKGKGFFRCHKSFIINKSHILEESNHNYVVLSNHKEIPISRRRKDTFSNWNRNL
ncbi:LytTR family DNA-binding domain-containing protein [Mangrovimonas sp. ST2L15]|uniref:LytR/AlgR family response regulator transcription factor n=1 Tax=Mangrovimonas sp. ST2L15 TaxID=1645916 RepID=UPI000B177D93|nr:LytTR family DNA-binding domain-containing protein [Mangrovimonas sp. ST2L15]